MEQMKYYKKWNNITGWAVFAIASLVYILTMEPTASLWDCSEFIATSYKLEVGHPPGAPLFMMIARFFTLFAPSTEHVALMVNLMSSLGSGFTILFLFWTITHLARKIYCRGNTEMTTGQIWTVIGAGIIGALAYTFTDTFWFSAIEGEVYALSSMFTAMVVWAMLKWEDAADEPHANRWLVLISYMMGLSIGIHILNLLTIPALVFIYYFRKYPKVTKKGLFGATLLSGALIVLVNYIIIPSTIAVGAFFDRIFANGLGLPVNTGIVIFALLLFGLCGWLVWYTHKKGKVVANTVILCVTVILIGYSSFASMIIRAAVDPPMNSNNPNNPYALLKVLNREQYGNRPLLYGPYYSCFPINVEKGTTWYLGDDGKYVKTEFGRDYVYPDQFKFFFPRMYSAGEGHPEAYESWSQIKGRRVRYQDEVITVPTFGENLKFFFSYQMNFMYWRYFLWNFVGRQSDIQGLGNLTNGNWLSGINFIDQIYLGPQDNLPSEMKQNRGRNRYYFLPFILGLIGLIYQLNRDKRNFTVVMWLFLMMGLVLVLYFNSPPGEPRERDYVYAGSFYAYCMWIGFGVLWVRDMLVRLLKKENLTTAVAATVICSCVPIILAAENWDDHNRSRRYVARDIGWNYLMTALPNSIVVNFGDNDTFPLWYNQEVEGVRPDIKVMNMSYLGADWYIDQMKVRSNEADPVPFSLPKHKYTYTNESFFVYERYETMSLKQLVDFIIMDDKRTKISLTSGESDYIPARNFTLAVNKENAIKSGIVKPEDAHLMVDTLHFHIPENKNQIPRSDLMIFDMLANFDWSRPIFFTQPQLLSYGLQDYLQYDGYGYRLVPIQTKRSPYKLHLGRVDPEYLYDKLMNVNRYGNVEDERVYCDYFVHHNFLVSNARSTFGFLAEALIEQGDTVRAVEVLDAGVQKVPFSQIRHSYKETIPIIDGYYRAGAMEKGNVIFDDYARVLKEYITYFGAFPESKIGMVYNEYMDHARTLNTLLIMAGQNGDKEREQDIARFLSMEGFRSE